MNTLVLNYCEISSKFGQRTHPITGKKELHNGVDLYTHSPIFSPADGIITKVWSDSRNGRALHITHNQNGTEFISAYAHLWGFMDGIKIGMSVKKGDIIGYVGRTGLATGQHLHFGIFMGGKWIDPTDFITIKREG